MKMSQGNSLCSYLKQIKMSFAFLLQNLRTGGRNRSCLEGMVPRGRRRWGKGVGGWVWYKYCVQIYVIIEMRTVEK
jgi:hypothetical protein